MKFDPLNIPLDYYINCSLRHLKQRKDAHKQTVKLIYKFLVYQNNARKVKGIRYLPLNHLIQKPKVIQ